MLKNKKTWIAAAALLAGAALAVVGPNAFADGEDREPPAPPDYAAEQVGVTEAADAEVAYGGERVLRYPGAPYVKVHFSRVLLAEGDHLTVSNEDGTESHRYTGTAAGTWATSVSGEAAVIRLHRADGGTPLDELAFGEWGATVDEVARGLTDDELAARRAARREPESLCGSDDKRDAVCYRETDPEAYAATAPVARLLINGTTLCTAWRVGPDNRMLTNHHCFTTTGTARDTEVWFGYECETCGGLGVTEPVKVYGDEVLATERKYDYTLFTVDDFAAVEPFGYLELDDRVAAKGEKLYIPQHPGGVPMQLAVDSDAENGGHCRVEDGTYAGYEENTDVAYLCDTEFGSSGSPVISRETGKVIGLHHFGGCPNSGVRSDLLVGRIGDLI